MTRPELIPLTKGEAKKLPSAVLKTIKRLKRKKEKRVKRWNKRPKIETENKCWFRAWVIEKVGEERACKTLASEYDNCPLKCEWIPKCPHCGGLVIKHILSQNQDTNGMIMTMFGASCPNSECPSNQKKIEPIQRRPDFYV